MLQNNLKIMREKNEYSKLELALISGVSRRTIMLIETGRSKNPRIESLKRLSQALNVTVDELIK